MTRASVADGISLKEPFAVNVRFYKRIVTTRTLQSLHVFRPFNISFLHFKK